MVLRSLPISEQYQLMSSFLGTSNRNTLAYALDTARQDPYMANNVLQRRFAPDGGAAVNDIAVSGSYTQGTQPPSLQDSIVSPQAPPPVAGGNASVTQNGGNVNPQLPDNGGAPQQPATPDVTGGAETIQLPTEIDNNAPATPGSAVTMQDILTALGLAAGGAGAYGLYRHFAGGDGGARGSFGGTERAGAPVGAPPPEGPQNPRMAGPGAAPLEGEYIQGVRAPQQGTPPRQGNVYEGEAIYRNSVVPGAPAHPGTTRRLDAAPSGAMDANGVPLLPGGQPSQYDLPPHQDARVPPPQVPPGELITNSAVAAAQQGQDFPDRPRGSVRDVLDRQLLDTVPRGAAAETDTPTMPDTPNDTERALDAQIDTQDDIARMSDVPVTHRQGGRYMPMTDLQAAVQRPMTDQERNTLPRIVDGGTGVAVIQYPAEGTTVSIRNRDFVRIGHFLIDQSGGDEVFDTRTGFFVADPAARAQIIDMSRTGRDELIMRLTPDIDPRMSMGDPRLVKSRTVGRGAASVF